MDEALQQLDIVINHLRQRMSDPESLFRVAALAGSVHGSVQDATHLKFVVGEEKTTVYEIDHSITLFRILLRFNARYANELLDADWPPTDKTPKMSDISASEVEAAAKRLGIDWTGKLPDGPVAPAVRYKLAPLYSSLLYKIGERKSIPTQSVSYLGFTEDVVFEVSPGQTVTLTVETLNDAPIALNNYVKIVRKDG